MLFREFLHEVDKLFSLDGSWVQHEALEATFCADRRDHSHGLNLEVGVHHLDSIAMRGPRLGAECAEGEHSLIQEDDLLIAGLRELYKRSHAGEEVAVLLLVKVDLLLHALDELVLDLVALVKAPQSRYRDLDLSEPPVEPLDTLLQRGMCLLVESVRAYKIGDVMPTELLADCPYDWIHCYLGLHSSLDEVDDGAQREPGQLRNGRVVEKGPRKLGLCSWAEPEEHQVLHELGILTLELHLRDI